MILKINENTTQNLDSTQLSPLAEECLLEMEVSGLYLAEAAKFRFMPRLKERSDLKRLWDVCQRAEDALNKEGEKPSLNIMHKFGKLASRILSVILNYTSIVTVSSTITDSDPGNVTSAGNIVPKMVLTWASVSIVKHIPIYLMTRVIDYGIQLGEDKVAKSYAKECIESFKKIKEKIDDPKKKEKIDIEIEKLEKELKRFDNKKKSK